MEKLFTQQEVARTLQISERTLERHRLMGTGPRWVRLGRLVRYRMSDLETWIRAVNSLFNVGRGKVQYAIRKASKETQRLSRSRLEPDVTVFALTQEG